MQTATTSFGAFPRCCGGCLRRSISLLPPATEKPFRFLHSHAASSAPLLPLKNNEGLNQRRRLALTLTFLAPAIPSLPTARGPPATYRRYLNGLAFRVTLSLRAGAGRRGGERTGTRRLCSKGHRLETRTQNTQSEGAFGGQGLFPPRHLGTPQLFEG